MTRRFRRQVGLALLAASLLQWAWAVPAAVAAELRALDCCERHCDHEVVDARTCCGTPAAVADGASLRHAPEPSFTAAVVPLPGAHLPAAPPGPGIVGIEAREPAPPPSPPWIRNLSLRL